MATNEEKSAKAAKEKAAADLASRAYEKALEDYSAALTLLQQGEYSQALEALRKVSGSNPDEPTLVERSRTYERICEQRLAEKPAEPSTGEGLYYHAVICSNNGETEEAIRLLNRALETAPASPSYLYARASAQALQGNAEAAIGDLRQAIHGDPQFRFQAVNDSDFEKIREEPGFIDIIEPTPTGA